MKVIITAIITLFTLVGYTQNTNDVIKYVNLARTNPKTFRDSVVVFYNTTKSKYEIKNRLLTTHGIKVTHTSKINFDSIFLSNINDLIIFLDTVKAVRPLQYSEKLDSSLKIHKGITHDDVFNRVNKYIKSDYVSENISYNDKDPLKSVINLMVDFDNHDMGHRKTIMDCHLTKIAVSYVGESVYIQEFCK